MARRGRSRPAKPPPGSVVTAPLPLTSSPFAPGVIVRWSITVAAGVPCGSGPIGPVSTPSRMVIAAGDSGLGAAGTGAVMAGACGRGGASCARATGTPAKSARTTQPAYRIARPFVPARHRPALCGMMSRLARVLAQKLG